MPVIDGSSLVSIQSAPRKSYRRLTRGAFFMFFFFYDFFLSIFAGNNCVSNLA